MDISQREFQEGLTYVAVSRVKTIEGVMFEGRFDFEYFRSAVTQTAQDRQTDLMRRLPQHVTRPAQELYPLPHA
ncbi:hypothetical protein CPLU01_15750 [Colletotrichum plurivorum]|uniref:Uncharacterized protein n=1 Tax=Colletotrichum plurivorum TaxID=2175906 RepID=A0A8H6J7J1_9PEZI|nr:hypothetical protein CPLU01_15750 [Colletotrichum plurivorum]